ncbi:WD40 repeat domain-containing protein [Nonomuraea sp. FMUSA5-5]|uniref:WD40 repeat domain-containing protein n=1 Tax=Nonomuraea composti TaxID=2720023 RepID=A0ABX1B4A7_9ACTN|nr:WD40 repeat domain-containing protein [Nonomuraea sp. FMUSA5-5]NJP91370.1 WD40 repeat domain-containing protein [Nonomuraea sp. FMUSA5-5]
MTSGHRDGRPEVRVWDVAARAPVGGPLPVADLPGKSRYFPVFSPDGRTLALTHTASPVVTLWDATTGRATGALRVREPAAVGVLSVAFSPDGRTLAIAPLGGGAGGPYIGDLELWDVRTGRWLRTVAHAGAQTLIFEPDGRRLLVDKSTKGRVLVDLATGALRPHHSDGRAQGRILFMGDKAAIGDPDGRLTFWDRDLRTLLAPPQALYTGSVAALVPYPRGELLATVGSEGDTGIQLWDWRGHQRIGTPMSYYTDSVPAVAFDRTALLISSSDGALRRIIVDPGAAATAICRQDGGLSPAEWRRHIPELPYRRTCP